MATERKQVLTPADQVDENVPVANAPTQTIDGTVHGDIADLTIEGTNFSDAPVNTVLPVITGTAQEDEELSVDTGEWVSQQPITGYAYQWRAGGVDIADADEAAYTPVTGDVGGVITCEVTATSDGGSTTAESEATAEVIAAG